MGLCECSNVAGRGFVRHLGQSEIQHLHRAVRAKDDVARLQIAVHDTLLVRGFERVGNLPGDRQRLIQRHGALPDALRQGGSLHQFHHQVIGADVVELADVGMIQRSHRVYFAREAVAEALGGDFDGHVAAHTGIVRAIDFAHASGADGRADLVRAEFGAGGERHAMGFS